MTRVFQGNDSQFVAATNNMFVKGAAAGNETLLLQSGVQGISVDANIERLELAGNLAEYRFIYMTGQGMQVQTATGAVLLTLSSLNQNTNLVFSDGAAELQQTGASQFLLGNQVIPALSAAAFSMNNIAGFDAAEKSTVANGAAVISNSPVRVFMGSQEKFYGASTNLIVKGASAGNETLLLKSGVVNVMADANIERVELPESLAQYRFVFVSGQGSQLQDAAGAVLLTISSLNQDATVAFADGSATLQQVGSTQFLLGGQAIQQQVASVFSTNTLNGFNTNDKSGVSDTTIPVPVSLLETAQNRSVVNTGLSTLATSATEYVNTLDSGTHWGKSNLTYSFNTAIPAEYTSNPDLTTGWRQLTTTEKNAVNAVIADINTLLGVQLTAVSSNGDLRFNAVSQTGNTAGFAFSPGSEEGGDVFLDRNAPAANYAIGADSYFTVVHEVGHALGLKHPFEGSPVLPTNLDNTVHSVMSYTEFRGREFVATWNTATNSVSATNAVTRTQSEFSLYDVHTLQALYGGNATHNTGNDTYTAVAGSYQTLWDAGGKDLIDLSNTAGVAKIDLRPGTLSSADIKTLDDLIAEVLADLVGQGAPSGAWLTNWVTTSVTQYEPELYNGTNNLTIPLGVLIEEVKTGGNHDEVRDNAVDNRISTGAGNDSIFLGQGGFDVIDAGLGSDKVFFDIPSTAVQREAQTDGSVVVVAANFAAQLIGVETLVFSDQQISL